MASVMASFVYLWALLPLLTGGDVPDPCVFPFTYNGKSYNSCTMENSDKPWCSTTAVYNSQWKYCWPHVHNPCVFPFTYNGKSYNSCTTDNSDKLWCSTTAVYNSQWKYCLPNEYGGNSDGKPCVFPYIYKSRTFYTCTNEDPEKGMFWCATTGNYDEAKQWSYCADTRLSANNETGPCVFPFIYRGKSYASCTTDGNEGGQPWCSLTRNYDQSPQWTYCKPSEALPCHFPFIYQGTSHYACTRDGSPDNQLWCATTANYDTDKKWRACALQDYEGNSNGQPCVFPFIYDGQTFFSCTNQNSDGRFWCATTGNYDKDQKWSYCADTRLNGSPTGQCVFPFIYKGKSYSSCTTDGLSGEYFWCSLTSNYDRFPKLMCCIGTGAKGTTTEQCVFPFIYNGKSYSSCTTDGTSGEYLWCSLTSNYDKDPKWMRCPASGDQNPSIEEEDQTSLSPSQS